MPRRLLHLTLLAIVMVLAVPRARADDTPKVVVTDEVKELTWLGFQQLKDASRIFVRTNEPVRYKYRWKNSTTLLFEVFNTQVLVRNHLRFLDTKFFNGPVLFVRPSVVEAVSPTTRIEISVREKVPFQIKQEDNLIFIDFRR